MPRVQADVLRADHLEPTAGPERKTPEATPKDLARPVGAKQEEKVAVAMGIRMQDGPSSGDEFFANVREVLKGCLA
jgi:hypothetical protein